jgi:hypothetical protein
LSAWFPQRSVHLLFDLIQEAVRSNEVLFRTLATGAVAEPPILYRSRVRIYLSNARQLGPG